MTDERTREPKTFAAVRKYRDTGEEVVYEYFRTQAEASEWIRKVVPQPHREFDWCIGEFE